MEQHVLEFLYRTISRYHVSITCDDVSAEYTIELDSGSFLFFECRYARDDRNRPARYYAVSLDDQIIAESYCLESTRKPSVQTRQLMRLIERCSNKILAQEIQARKSGLLNQITPSKVHS